MNVTPGVEMNVNPGVGWGLFVSDSTAPVLRRGHTSRGERVGLHVLWIR